MAVQTTTRGDHVARALGWMAVAVGSFILVAIAGREAAKGLSTLDMMVYRSLLSLLAVVLLALSTHGLGTLIPTRRFGLHTVRAGAHLVAQFSWLYALTLMPLAQLFALEFTAPLWVALLAPLLLGERLTALRIAAAVLGFIGALVVVRPGQMQIGLGEMLALVSALGFALSMLCTKRLTSSEPTLRILFYMFLIQTVICAAMTQGVVRVPEGWIIAWVVLLAAGGLSAHYALARAFALADSIIVAPMDFLRLPLIAIIGMVVYAEPLDPFVLVGGGVVVAANLLNLWGERRGRKV